MHSVTHGRAGKGTLVLDKRAEGPEPCGRILSVVEDLRLWSIWVSTAVAWYRSSAEWSSDICAPRDDLPMVTTQHIKLHYTFIP